MLVCVQRPPHDLVYAKQKGFSYWPAKVIKVTPEGYDVRFFGGLHQRWDGFTCSSWCLFHRVIWCAVSSDIWVSSWVGEFKGGCVKLLLDESRRFFTRHLHNWLTNRPFIVHRQYIFCVGWQCHCYWHCLPTVWVKKITPHPLRSAVFWHSFPNDWEF